MEYAILAISIVAVLISIVVLIFVVKQKKSNEISIKENDIKKIKDSLNDSISSLSKTVGELVAEKNSSLMNDLNNKIDNLNKRIDELNSANKELERQYNEYKIETNKLLNDNNEKVTNYLNIFVSSYKDDSVKQKEEIMKKITDEIQDFNKNVKEVLNDFKANTNDSIKELKITVEKQLGEIREDNNKKLEQINSSVNEKLESALDKQLKDSFKSVVEGIGDVNKAIGEIRGLATDVGSLKNVLTNVKTKGNIGEYSLGGIIKEFLVLGQYEENIVTKIGSKERVEFAIRLPGTKDNPIYLPIDSKFPLNSYQAMMESDDKATFEAAKKKLRSDLLKYAKEIASKYIDVPNTTDFAVMYLPLEGLYLEALNIEGLYEELQKIKINVAGPTTLTAFVNSLNLGFRTLMIQKKSADVFKTLGAVKTEFSKFADCLTKTKKKVEEANDELDTLLKTRTRKLNMSLNSIDALDENATKAILESNETQKE